LSDGEDVGAREDIQLCRRFPSAWSVAVKFCSRICTTSPELFAARDAEVGAALLAVAAGAEVEHGELRAVVERVVVGDLGDEDLDEHLRDGAVELFEDRLDLLEVLGLVRTSSELVSGRR
jgi:hypothetical protein